jgi:hypothetical protein
MLKERFTLLHLCLFSTDCPHMRTAPAIIKNGITVFFILPSLLSDELPVAGGQWEIDR